ncbi:hypothetical protein [Methanosarcina sp.]|uniref:hypothetical protein n=1 Tax=Methanosarcina sp. TaxID=2213 RepID=UPI003C715D46
MEIEVSLNDYYSSYETMAKEIREGIDEGFDERVIEGIKQEFVAGIRGCRVSGFNNNEMLKAWNIS